MQKSAGFALGLYVGLLQVVFGAYYAIGQIFFGRMLPMLGFLILLVAVVGLCGYLSGRSFGLRSGQALRALHCWLLALATVVLTPLATLLVVAIVTMIRVGVPTFVRGSLALSEDFPPPAPPGFLGYLLGYLAFLWVTARYSFGLGMWHGLARQRRRTTAGTAN